MSALKGITKVVLALIALGAGSQLGKRGLEDLKRVKENQPNNQSR